MLVSNNSKYVINHFTVFNICALIFLVNIVSSHKCYICGFQPNVTSCDKFDPTNQKLFAKECPEKYIGCSIQKNDTHTVRSCEDIKINDCQKANNVSYCYCSADLCNGINIDFGNPQKLPPDDEDAEEGSGRNGLSRESTPIPSIEDETTKSTSNGVILQSCITLILVLIVL